MKNHAEVCAENWSCYDAASCGGAIRLVCFVRREEEGTGYPHSDVIIISLTFPLNTFFTNATSTFKIILEFYKLTW